LGAYGGYVQSRSCDGQVSLFLAGPVIHGKIYSGVADGIYSINGTYGGTTGLEHMHQIVGAPSTIDTWVNMVNWSSPFSSSLSRPRFCWRQCLSVDIIV